MDCHTSSAILSALCHSVLNSNDATAALTMSGNISFHLDCTKMEQQQLTRGDLSLQINLINFFAVCEGEPSK